MDRAYSLLTVKSVKEDQRIIMGIATSPSPDRMGDIVEPMGLRFRNPMPLLLHHQHDKPVGTVKFSKATKGGIQFEATLPKIDEPGILKDRVDEAWHSVKHGLVAGVSIGFRALDFERMEKGGLRFTDAECLELSLVTIPANADATIQTIKSIDSNFMAASGQVKSADDQKAPPGVSGLTSIPIHRKVKHTMAKQTIAEQISAFEATRAAKDARMREMMEKAHEEGATLDAEQSEEYDTLETEVKSIDAHLARLATLEKTNRTTAKPVEGVTDTKSASEARSGAVGARVEVRNLPKGTLFTRYAMAVAAGKGSLSDTIEYAKRWEGQTPEVINHWAFYRQPGDWMGWRTRISAEPSW
jgi:HK97 family phage prohead protease